MTVSEAVRIASEDSLIQTTFPKWVFNLPFKRLRDSRIAHDKMRQFMTEQVEERKAMMHSGEVDNNAFSLLVKASEDGEGKFALDDDELVRCISTLCEM